MIRWRLRGVEGSGASASKAVSLLAYADDATMLVRDREDVQA